MKRILGISGSIRAGSGNEKLITSAVKKVVSPGATLRNVFDQQGLLTNTDLSEELERCLSLF